MIKKLCMISIILLCTPVLWGQDDKTWTIEAGLKFVLNREQTPDYIYINPIAGISQTIGSSELNAVYSPYFNYKITNGLGQYKYIDIHRAGIGLLFPCSEKCEIASSYYYLYSIDNYSGHDVSLGLTWYIKKISVYASYNGNFTDYDFNGNVSSTEHAFEGGIGYDLTDSLTLEGSIDYSGTDYNTLDEVYVQKNIRGGVSYISLFSGDTWTNSIIILGGISLGMDSDDYSIFGLDAGGIVKVFDCMKLKVQYVYKYYSDTVDASSKSTKKSGNPNLIEYVDSYATHKIVVGASMYY